eukprot:4296038-Pyramimonas_sp.AAC.1
MAMRAGHVAAFPVAAPFAGAHGTRLAASRLAGPGSGRGLSGGPHSPMRVCAEFKSSTPKPRAATLTRHFAAPFWHVHILMVIVLPGPTTVAG